MAGIGEASAVIGVVQIGFSLARTLNTYIGDYKDSRESISSLAAELDATIIQVRELNSLVVSNKVASEGSKKLAEKCVKDSDRLVKKLVELLTKAGQPEDPESIVNIKPEDLNVSRLTRAYWPLIKPKVDVVKSELHLMKSDILIARSCIQAQSGLTAAERSAGGDSIVALAKSRRLAKRLLQEAKAEEKRLAMRSQQRDPVLDRPSGRLDDSNGPRGDETQRYPSGHYARPHYGSYAEDVKDTELMARDLRDSILEDLRREDADRKAKEVAEEVARDLAVEAYQKSVKDKLARLQEVTNATQRQIEDIFGSTVTEEQMKMFLSQEQSRQMQDEIGEELLKFGAVPSLPTRTLAKDAHAGPKEEGAPKRRRRWFSRRHPSYSSASSITGNRRTTRVGSDSPTQKPAHFIHIAMSYDTLEGDVIYQTVDNPAIQHQPCGSHCDFQGSMKVWRGLPRGVRVLASKWVERNFSTRTWHLHAALPIEKDARKTRSLVQRTILGDAVHQDTNDVLLVFTSADSFSSSDADATTVGDDARSITSHTNASVANSAVSRVTLTKADVEQIRDLLVSRGVDAEKLDKLDSLLLARKDAAENSIEPKVKLTQPDSPDVQPATAGVYQMDPGRQESGNTVRFVDGDVAPYTDVNRNSNKDISYNNYSRGRGRSRSPPYPIKLERRPSRVDYEEPYPLPRPPPSGTYLDFDRDDRRSRMYYMDVDNSARSRDPTASARQRGRNVNDNDEYPHLNVYNDDEWANHPRRHSARHQYSNSYLDPHAYRRHDSNGLYRTRTPSRSPPRNARERHSVARPVVRPVPAPLPGYWGRDDTEMAKELAELRLERRMRSRSRGRSDASSHGNDARDRREFYERELRILEHEMYKEGVRDGEIHVLKLKLEGLRRDQLLAERARNLDLASDLKYIAIPDIEHRVETLERERAAALRETRGKGPDQLHREREEQRIRIQRLEDEERRAADEERQAIEKRRYTQDDERGQRYRVHADGTAVYDWPGSSVKPCASQVRARSPSPDLNQRLNLRYRSADVVRYPNGRRHFSLDHQDGEYHHDVERGTSRRRELVPLRSMSSQSRQSTSGPALYGDDGWLFHTRRPDRASRRADLYTETLNIRRDLSPEKVVEDLEEAEDDMMDDAELKDKMLVKYTGRTALPEPEPQADAPASHLEVNAADTDVLTLRSKSPEPVPGIQRQHTATVEDIDENEDHASDAGAGASVQGKKDEAEPSSSPPQPQTPSPVRSDTESERLDNAPKTAYR